MAAVGWLIRHQLRRRWPALLPMALLVACGATAAFVAAGAADRTGGAYGAYLEQADVSDVVVNPSLSTTEIAREIGKLPGVRSVTADALFFAGIDHEGGSPRSAGQLNASTEIAQVRGSADGRYLTMDRPALREGRMPTGLNEAVVSAELAEDEGVGLGDTLPVSFWGRVEGTDVHPDFAEDPDQLFPPVGYETLAVVGIGALSDEVLPDGLYPRQRIILSSQMAARYDCVPDVPPVDATFEEALDVLVPEGCATAYRYYALDLDGGAGQVEATMDAFLQRATELNAALPPALTEDGASYFLITTTTAQESERIERSIQPTVAALGVLGGVAGVVTVVVAGLAVARELRRSEDDLDQWRQLGLTTTERAGVVAAPLLIAVGAGLLVAVAATWVLSPIGPVGSVRSVAPDPARELSPWVGAGLAGLAVVAVAGIVLLATGATRHAGRPVVTRRRNPSSLQQLLRRSPRPEVTEGIRAAQTGYRGAGLVMASGGVAAATFLAAVVFGASLSAVVSSPAAYGWPWDLATMTGFGYGPVLVEGEGSVAESLEGRDDVESWTVLGFTNDMAVEGKPVLAVIGLERSSTVDFPLVDGRLPTSADEVALGSLTARDLGVGVGDTVDVDGESVGPRTLTVTGRVVLPPLGPYQADRAAPGTGMLVTERLLPEDFVLGSATFVGIDLVPDADVDAVFSDLRDDFGLWEQNDWGTFDYGGPVRPAEIVDADRMQAVPLLAGVLLVVAAVIGLSLAVVVSVRSRRRELAILRALGFTGRQLRDSVRVQALATMVVALVIGVPVGLALGRLAWRAFADQLGVAAGPVVPVWWVVATVAGGFMVALLAAAVPARAASRVDPATILRSE